MIRPPNSNIARDAAELVARMEAALPSIYEPYTPQQELPPYFYPYSCRRHDVKGNSPTAYPRICWFGGESVRPATTEAHSMTRGMPRR